MSYDKQCWSCGKLTMEPKGSYYQCSECGATWNEPPTLAGQTYIIEPVPVQERDASIGRTHSPPSYRVTKIAKKARKADKGGKL